MEYITVTYPEPRIVFIDGEEGGVTNDILRVEAGTHTFSLGDPPDYAPGAVVLNVARTSPVIPMEVRFERL